MSWILITFFCTENEGSEYKIMWRQYNQILWRLSHLRTFYLKAIILRSRLYNTQVALRLIESTFVHRNRSKNTKRHRRIQRVYLHPVILTSCVTLNVWLFFGDSRIQVESRRSRWLCDEHRWISRKHPERNEPLNACTLSFVIRVEVSGRTRSRWRVPIKAAGSNKSR